MKTNSTKKALLASLLSLLLCASMLVGSTFAWFTDTASTAVNSIQAGTLKVELWKGDSNESLGSEPLKWVAADGRAQNGILWEPGATYSLESFRIKNAGNLALKYKVVINGLVGSAKLLEAIDFTVTVDGTLVAKDGTSTATTAATLNNFEGKLGAGAVTGKITITGHMKEDAGNEYMNEKIEGISITVVATQDTVEKDGTGDQYDKDAAYPVAAFAPVTKDADGLLAQDAEIASAEKNAETKLPMIKATVPAGAKLDDGATGLKLVIEEAKNPEGITVEITQVEPKTLEISMEGLAADNDRLIKVEFYLEKGFSLLEIYHNGRKMVRCSAPKWVDVDQEFYYDSDTGLVTMLTKTFSPFTYTSDKKQWDNMTANTYQTPVDTENKVITVSSAEELALFKYEITDKGVNYTGYTLNITADIDLGSGFWRPIAKIDGMTINGNGHTISNLLVRSSNNPRGYGFGFISDAVGKVTIRDLKFDAADVAYSKYANYVGNVGAVVLAYAYGTTLFENVLVVNSSINGYGKIGMLLGMGAEPGVKVTFRNCVSMDNTIRAVYNIGGLAGNIQRKAGVDNAAVENCTVENINVIYDTRESYADLVKASATFKSDDQPTGTDVVRDVDGKYWIYDGLYWGGYADYYVSYGNSAYDAPVRDKGFNLSNSEYCVNKAN